MEVYIDDQINYYVNPEGPNAPPMTIDQVFPALQDAVAKDNSGQNSIVLRADKSVHIEYVVKLMDVVNKLNEERAENDRYKIVLATEAE